MHHLPLLFILLLTNSLCESANILGLFPIHVKSHYIMFERLLKRLAERGHDVDMVTQFPAKNVPPKYNQISLAGSLPSLVNNLPFELINDFSYYGTLKLMTTVGGVGVCEASLKTQELKNLKNTKKKYDLVMTEVFGSDCMLGFGHLFNVPVIGMISSVALPWLNDRIGNPENPSYIPNYFVAFTSKMSLFERVENTLLLIMSKIGYHFLSSKDSNKLSKEFFGASLPSLEELALNTSLILVNSHFSISHARPTVPNFIEVGGLHVEEPKLLSKHFQELIKTDTEGIIYLAMGSMILTETFDLDKLQGLFDAFAQLPYKVLWKANKERFSDKLEIPKNIHFEPWMPQTDILCHPNVKLFYFHGGLMGTHEAIHCGVPILGTPFFADQDHNIRALERMGLALRVAYRDITKKTIFNAAYKLLTDSSFKQNAERVSQQFKDRPLSPLDTAVFWVEYVIRHRGAPQLRTAGADLPWYQYYLVDVVLVTGFTFLLFLSGIVLFLRFFFKFMLLSKRKTD